MFVAGVVTKRKGFSQVLTLSKKQHRTLHFDPKWAGVHVWSMQMTLSWLFEIARLFQNTNLFGIYLFQMDGVER